MARGPYKNARMVEYNGERMTMGELARRSGLSQGTLHQRIVNAKWSVERAVTQPVAPPFGGKKRVEASG